MKSLSSFPLPLFFGQLGLEKANVTEAGDVKSDIMNGGNRDAAYISAVRTVLGFLHRRRIGYDRTVARRLGTAGRFGAWLDSIENLVFFLSTAVKMLPNLWDSLPVLSLRVVCVIAGIQYVTAVFGTVKFRRLCFLHTYKN